MSPHLKLERRPADQILLAAEQHDFDRNAMAGDAQRTFKLGHPFLFGVASFSPRRRTHHLGKRSAP